MNIVDKEQFAVISCMPSNKLAVYIQRKKVITLSDGKIDLDDPRNKAFSEKWSARAGGSSEVSKTKPASEKKSSTEKGSTVSGSEEEDSVENIKQGPSQTYTESERLLKYYDTVKRKAEIEKLLLQIQKSKGEVVPSASVKPIFLEHNQSIISTVHDRMTEFVMLFSKKRTLTLDEIADLKGKVSNWVNETMEKALEVSIKKISATIEEHSESKNVGEHG